MGIVVQHQPSAGAVGAAAYMGGVNEYNRWLSEFMYRREMAERQMAMEQQRFDAQMAMEQMRAQNQMALQSQQIGAQRRSSDQHRMAAIADYQARVAHGRSPMDLAYRNEEIHRAELAQRAQENAVPYQLFRAKQAQQDSAREASRYDAIQWKRQQEAAAAERAARSLEAQRAHEYSMAEAQAKESWRQLAQERDYLAQEDADYRRGRIAASQTAQDQGFRWAMAQEQAGNTWDLRQSEMGFQGQQAEQDRAQRNSQFEYQQNAALAMAAFREMLDSEREGRAFDRQRVLANQRRGWDVEDREAGYRQQESMADRSNAAQMSRLQVEQDFNRQQKADQFGYDLELGRDKDVGTFLRQESQLDYNRERDDRLWQRETGRQDAMDARLQEQIGARQRADDLRSGRRKHSTAQLSEMRSLVADKNELWKAYRAGTINQSEYKAKLAEAEAAIEEIYANPELNPDYIEPGPLGDSFEQNTVVSNGRRYSRTPDGGWKDIGEEPNAGADWYKRAASEAMAIMQHGRTTNADGEEVRTTYADAWRQVMELDPPPPGAVIPEGVAKLLKSKGVKSPGAAAPRVPSTSPPASERGTFDRIREWFSGPAAVGPSGEAQSQINAGGIKPRPSFRDAPMPVRRNLSGPPPMAPGSSDPGVMLQWAVDVINAEGGVDTSTIDIAWRIIDQWKIDNGQ